MNHNPNLNGGQFGGDDEDFEFNMLAANYKVDKLLEGMKGIQAGTFPYHPSENPFLTEYRSRHHPAHTEQDHLYRIAAGHDAADDLFHNGPPDWAKKAIDDAKAAKAEREQIGPPPVDMGSQEGPAPIQPKKPKKVKAPEPKPITGNTWKYGSKAARKNKNQARVKNANAGYKKFD